MTLGPLALAMALSLGQDPLVRALKVASNDYHEAIAHAVELVDPLEERPWLGEELYRICLRESRCGQFGSPGLHEVDGWTGVRAYQRAVQRGRLEPDTCPGHSLEGRGARQFATRGGWGTNAARGLRYLDGCHGPEELDEPRVAALVAARMLVGCRECTCSDRAALWVGRGTMLARPAWSWGRKSRVSSVLAHCGPRGTRLYALAQLLESPSRLLSWFRIRW